MHSPPESISTLIGLITLGRKTVGARSAGNMHAACDVWRELETGLRTSLVGYEGEKPDTDKGSFY